MATQSSYLIENASELFGLAVTAVLLLVGLLSGTIAERQHVQRLQRREAQLRHMLATNLSRFPAAAPASSTPALVVGGAVLTSDYFRVFVSKLKNLIGGRLGFYERLTDRCRREAIVRMLEQAQSLGFNAVGNIRLEGVDISGSTKNAQKPVVTVGVIASGTAYNKA